MRCESPGASSFRGFFLRGLLYFSQLYQEYLTSKEISLFSSSLKKIPTPQFIVFYTGKKELPDCSVLKLSDAFEVPVTEENFEWTCIVLNLNSDHNKELNKKCKPLYDYCRFVEKVKLNREDGMSLDKAIENAVDWATKENLLEGFFKRERSQIMGFYLAEFDEEVYKKNVYQDGLADGREEGARENALQNARNALKMGLTPDQVSQITGLSSAEILTLKNELTETAVS